MAASECSDYGDDFDDTAFFEAATQAATQAERDHSPAFLPSPRPPKRRKIDQPNERTTDIPPSPKHQSKRRRPFVDSSDEEPAICSRVHDHGRARDHDREPSERAATPCTTATATNSTRGASKRKRNSRSKAGELDNHNEDDGRGSCTSSKRLTVAERRKNQIHVPKTNLDLSDVFATQRPQSESPPWKQRGAIWQKPTTSIGVHRPSEPPKQPALPGRQSIPSRPSSRGPRPPVAHETQAEVDSSPKLPPANATVSNYDPTDELADLPSDAFASSSSPPEKQQHGDDVVFQSERRTRLVVPQTGLRQTTLFGRERGPDGDVPASQVNKRYNFVVDAKEEPPTHHKLDPEAIKTWVYPTNLGKIRDYQFNIVARGLYHNLLVALPTGLGKTFIAATIMLNWFRWTTDAQIIFVAPTKPLVAQQIEACFKIAGIPRSQTTMLIGGVKQALRAEEWINKRVFFMTPQTLHLDLKAGYADPKRVVLLVVDEAHRATGAYAYVEVVKFIRRFNPSFRVLALTATPGADVEAVQKVIDGLDIAKIEIRTENSIDIQEYVHQRTIEKKVLHNNDEMDMCMELYRAALKGPVNKLAGLNAFWSKDPVDVTPYGCTKARQKWMLESGRGAAQGIKWMVNNLFTILGSISQGMELLKYHSIGPFYQKLVEFRNSQEEGNNKVKKEICENKEFKKMMDRLKAWVSDENFVGHPKLEYLQEVILHHFVNAGEGTRIMVFAHFRDSAEEIVRVLKRHQPMIKPRVFVGQSNAKNSEGMGQKEQLAVIEKFKAGEYNTLIATSVGEEGLDIGEVDLIICYDSKASPIRMLQRMGRTGRKREGKIIMLQMAGKEERDAAAAKDSYEHMQKLIADGSSFTFHHDVSRRILPRDVQPTVDKRVVEIPPENSQADWLPEPKRGRNLKRPPKKFHMPDGVITGFVTAGRMDEEVVPKSRGRKKAVPVYPSEELLELPPLESVLLDENAAKDLERRFQTVFDEDDAPIIGELDLNKHPARQRVLSKPTVYRQAGLVTRAFVGTLQRMHSIDDDRLQKFREDLHHYDNESGPEHDIVVSDTESKPVIHEDMWADDDPASQPTSKPKAKPAPKPKTKASTVAEKTSPRPRGRPRKEVTTTVTAAAAPAITPVRQTKTKNKTPGTTPGTKTPGWRVSGLAEEGIESSPPPTDPRMRIASQADTIGSQDTMDGDAPQDTQAYLLDSELASFIVEDEDVEMPPSSLPSLDFGSGLGKGTQAVVRSATKKRRPQRVEKIFTSDPTDNEAVVSSDSDDDDVPMARDRGGSKARALVVDSESEEEEMQDSPIVARKRARRVIEDDDEDE
ncbi:P-loop containing nucleoside triphosphate hydrolase protein [Corynespora cassiicola Philippines]|uniref:ATP-dependent DNA helicase n=1 Tax=Corynespora cassiicola Philippines TaxID=1448308 RepID=A0A2T2NEI2_CORCC|nr:P-loop containing nucleoside triphosphate hydrolase protein [Corynespora cassiicola Philippines]